MENLVFFGKGGIGKSTIAANLTALLAAGGKKVLHVGCDPKMDSTLPLMGEHIPSFASAPGGDAGLRERIFPSPVKNAFCIEAGGPQPGVGCAGTGIGYMLDAMKDSGLLEKDGYQALVFDVLGDVVCGGFAAPLRRGFAKKAVIVTSEEILSLYAANRLIRMLEYYSRNGVFLAGLAVNLKRPEGLGLVNDFARAAGTRVLGVIPRDPAVAAAERVHRPAALLYPDSPFARALRSLGAAVAAARPARTPTRSMSEAEFFAFAEGRTKQRRKESRPAPAARALPAAAGGKRGKAEAAKLLEISGFKFHGMMRGQLIFDWKSSAGVFRVIILHKSAAPENVSVFSDWAVFFHPSVGGGHGDSAELRVAAERLSSLSFNELLAGLTGYQDFYGGLAHGDVPTDDTPSASVMPRASHTGFGQWQRFIVPSVSTEARISTGFVGVKHGDSECRFAECQGGPLGLFGRNNGGGMAARRLRAPFLPAASPCLVNTEFQTIDAVLGDAAKMTETLEAAAEQAGPGGLVELSIGCSPVRLGGDAVDAARRIEKKKNVKITVQKFDTFNGNDPVKISSRVDFISKMISRAPAKKKQDVNLVNFGARAGELAALLTARGISASEPGEAFCDEAAASRLQVFSAPETVFWSAFERAGLKCAQPRAPYGFAGTGAWLSAIAEALGRKKFQAGPSAAEKTEAAALRRRARAYTAALVLAGDELPLLSWKNAARTAGVLSVLAEAGFKTRLFVDAEGPSEKTAAGLELLKAESPGARLSAEFFKTPRELAALLSGDRTLRLVYSDLRRDRRVLSAGKSPFSAALFEPGYAGALETWRRLLELCEWDFNERYFV